MHHLLLEKYLQGGEEWGGWRGNGRTVSKLLTTQHLPQDVEPLPEIQLLTGEHLYTLQ